MNHSEIKKVDFDRMEYLENQYQDYLPQEIQQFYLLNFLLAHKLDAYIETYGLWPLDRRACEGGKVLSGLSPLNPFEIDCIGFLNDAVEANLLRNRLRQNGSLIGN